MTESPTPNFQPPITLIDEPPPEDTTPPPEQQSYAAPPFAWKDMALAPFAVDREAEWMLHRNLMGAPPLQDIIHDIGSVALDAMRVLWFCAHDPAEWCVPARDANARAQRLENRIRDWARDHISADEIPSAVSLFYEIFTRAHSTRASVAGDGRSPTAKN